MRLLLLRHGKSDWNVDEDDHARPLTGRGERSARMMGQFIAEAGAIPKLVLTSTAVRARTTVQHAIDAGDWDCEVRRLDDLYLTSVERLLKVVNEHAKGVKTVLVAGHEPTTSGAIAALTGARVRVPTAACASIQVDGPITPGNGELEWFVTPRSLGGVRRS